MGGDPSPDPARPPTPGTGVGLRTPHVAEILDTRPDLDFFELLTDNHLCDGGYARQQAYLVREHYPVSLHCVGMSLGGTDPLDFTYLDKIKTLARELEPMHISDHLCWTSCHSHHAHDLLPLPYTEEAVRHISRRIRDIQDYLETTLVVENVSSYLEFEASGMSEWEFLAAVAGESGSRILLDLNNIHVSHCNNGADAGEYIDNIPLDRVAEIHLAGFEPRGEYLLDAHNNKVSEPVWALYRQVTEKNPSIPTLIEWDNDLPPFEVLLHEAGKARAIQLQAANVQD